MHAEVGRNSVADIALISELNVEHPEHGGKDEPGDDPSYTTQRNYCSVAQAHFKYFARNATVSFQASAASSAR